MKSKAKQTAEEFHRYYSNAVKQEQAQEAFDKLNFQGDYERCQAQHGGRHFNFSVEDEFTTTVHIDAKLAELNDLLTTPALSRRFTSK